MQNYSEYVFSSDGAVVDVSCKFPLDWIRTEVYQGDFNGAPFQVLWGSPIAFDTYEYGLDLQIQPIGSNVQSGHPVGYQIQNARIIDLTVMPKDATFHSKFVVYAESEGVTDPEKMPFNGYLCLYFVDSAGKVVYRDNWYTVPVRGSTADGLISFTFDNSVNIKAIVERYGAVGLVPMYQLYTERDYPYKYSIHRVEYSNMRFTYSMSALQYESQQNERLQQTIDDVKDAMEKQNDKLDDIITGGSAGEDLMAGSDKLEDAGADLGDDLGAIQDFEDQYMGQLDDNIDEVVAGADLTWIYPSLSFVQHYLNKIVAGVPSKYLIVFTLPMFFGLFMYIVGHPIRAPRPDTSGDQVTRETFTTTQILAGPNAGRVRSTRTVTTSREIGRVHNE